MSTSPTVLLPSPAPGETRAQKADREEKDLAWIVKLLAITENGSAVHTRATLKLVLENTCELVPDEQQQTFLAQQLIWGPSSTAEPVTFNELLDDVLSAAKIGYGASRCSQDAWLGCLRIARLRAKIDLLNNKNRVDS